MWASKHAVFIGPGRLPRELKDVLHRQAQSSAELASEAPRLLAMFGSAVEAERVSAQLHAARVSSLVAGPEQPPAEDAWFVATSLELFAAQWRIGLSSGETRTLAPAEVTSVAIVDWRPASGGVDRGVLLRAPALERPVFLRAASLDPAAAVQNPADGIKRINELLDDCALAMHEGARRVSRRLGPEEFGGLQGELLPLAVAVVDALDVQQAQLSRPLAVRRSTSLDGELLPKTAVARMTSLALLLDGGLLGIAFAAMATVGAVGALQGHAGFLAASIAVLAAAMVKASWGRWLSREVFDRPLRIVEAFFRHGGRGTRPHAAHLLFDAVALLAVGWARTSLPHVTVIADLTLAVLGAGLVPTMSALTVVGRPDQPSLH